MIMYIPVEDETLGGTPILRRMGLKMAPPPRPRAPETQPPINPKTISLTRVHPRILRSLSDRPTPTFYLRACSFLTILIAITVMMQQKTTKLCRTTQSRALHLSMWAIDSILLLPLSKLVRTREINTMKHKACLSHCLWVFSLSRIRFSLSRSCWVTVCNLARSDSLT